MKSLPWSLRRSLAFVTALPFLGAGAQRTDSTAATDDRLSCAAYGMTARVWAGDDSAAAGPRRADSRTGAIDTTITLSIADRRWQRENVNAGVALGAAGMARGQSLPWRACAGASVHLGQVTTYLHNVSGSIHLRADVGALRAIERAPSSTPPAGPPRR